MNSETIQNLNSRNPWLTIELTNLCNYNCIMCYREEVDIKEKGFMSIRLFKEIIRDINNSGLRFHGLKLAWLGEAFMHPGISDILEILNDNKDFFKCLAIDTNISFIDEEYIRKLNKIEKDIFLFLSIDAAKEDTYIKIRKGGSFKKITGIIESIEKLRAPDIYLRYQFIPMKENIEELPQFLETIRKRKENIRILSTEITDLKEDYIFIRKLVYPGKEEESTELFSKAQKISGIEVNDKEQKVSENKTEKVCHKLYTMPIIRWNGMVGYCNNDPEMSLSPGTISERLRFSQIWIQEMEKMRKDQKNGEYHGKCEGCMKRT